jgi:HSP20 family protein
MPITLWSPVSELMKMNSQFNRLCDESLDRRTMEGPFGNWSPAVDLREEDGQYILHADMPGMRKEDIEINVENNVLGITGERRFESESTKDTYHRIERAYGKFVRSFTLPVHVVAESINASYKDGVLEVTIPKAEESKPKKISIKD